MAKAKTQSEEAKGTTYGVLAYALWGVFPLYFHILEPAGAWEVLCNRILWTLLVCAIALVITRQARFLRELVGNPKRLGMIALAGIAIAANWVIYVQAVVTGHVAQASLGYFLNPLFTVALGVIVLRERLRPLQIVAVAVGLVACLYLSVESGGVPWLALSLAFSFGTYGLLKNKIGGSLNALQSLTGETAVLAPAAAILLAIMTIRGQTTFTTHGVGHSLLLAASGIVTALPLLLFAAAAARVPLVSIGLMQFITPVLQLICGVTVLGEQLSTGRWIGFGIVWIALILLSIDAVRSATRGRRLARAAEEAAI